MLKQNVMQCNQRQNVTGRRSYISTYRGFIRITASNDIMPIPCKVLRACLIINVVMMMLRNHVFTGKVYGELNFFVISYLII